MVVVQAGQELVEKEVVKPAAAKLEPFCMSVADQDCATMIRNGKKAISDARDMAEKIRNPSVADAAELAGRNERVAQWSDAAKARASELERSSLYLKEAKLIVSWNRDAFEDGEVNKPAVAVTYDGPMSPLATALRYFDDSPPLPQPIDLHCPSLRSESTGGGSFMFENARLPQPARVPLEIAIWQQLDDTRFDRPRFGQSTVIKRCDGAIRLNRVVTYTSDDALKIVYRRSFDTHYFPLTRYLEGKYYYKCYGPKQNDEHFLFDLFDTLVTASTNVGEIYFNGDEWRPRFEAIIDGKKLSASIRTFKTGRRTSDGENIFRCEESLTLDTRP
jgi:hypothetical protein